jgi:hypothetical protein
VNPATAEQMTAPSADAIEVWFALTPAQYRAVGEDLDKIRDRLKLPKSVPNSQVILEAVRRQANPG